MTDARNRSGSKMDNAEPTGLLDKVEELKLNLETPMEHKRKRIVVVGLGMVGIAFM